MKTSVVSIHRRIHKDRQRKLSQAKQWAADEQAFIREHIGAPKAFLFLAGIGILWPLRLFAKRDKRRISFGPWHSKSRHKRSVSIYTKDGALIAQFGRMR